MEDLEEVVGRFNPLFVVGADHEHCNGRGALLGGEVEDFRVDTLREQRERAHVCCFGHPSKRSACPVSDQEGSEKEAGGRGLLYTHPPALFGSS
jgi:hypothetical protein